MSGTPLADAREAARVAREDAAAMRKRSYRRARLGFLILISPILLLFLASIYWGGYWTGYFEASGK